MNRRRPRKQNGRAKIVCLLYSGIFERDYENNEDSGKIEECRQSQNWRSTSRPIDYMFTNSVAALNPMNVIHVAFLYS